MSSKRRAKSRVSPPPKPVEVQPAIRVWGEVDLAAAVAVLLCLALGYLSRTRLSPDGVSYLDLAAALTRGDWSRFVQGYWSPLLPAASAAFSFVTGVSGPALVPVLHALNAGLAAGGVGIIWWWTRRGRPVQLGLAALSAFMLCSYGLPRIESLTPDVVLLAVTVWLSYELLECHGERWLIVGVLLGASFLAKTSSWPWLIVAVPIRLWGVRDAVSRLRVLKSTAVCAAVMSFWVVPMSVEAGRPTLGSSGSLNFSWYLLGEPTRSPDGDTHSNSAYQDIPTANGQQLRLVTYNDADHWTYQPWGDPVAWAENVVSEPQRIPPPLLVARFWARNAELAVGRWLLPGIVAVLLPAYLLQRRRGMWRTLVAAERDSLAVIALGLVGVLQFIAVHPEPRLIAPPGLMLTLGALHWLYAQSSSPQWSPAPMLRASLGWLGIVAAIGLSVPRLAGEFRMSRRDVSEAAQMRDVRSRLAAAGLSGPRVAVVGEAAPLLANAYRLGARIAAQVPVPSASLLSTLRQAQQRELLRSVFRGKVSLVWQRLSNGNWTLWMVQPSTP